jgi:hypothetical protein
MAITIKVVRLVGHGVCSMNKIGALNLNEKNKKNPGHEPSVVVLNAQACCLSLHRFLEFTPFMTELDTREDDHIANQEVEDFSHSLANQTVQSHCLLNTLLLPETFLDHPKLE